MTISPIKTKDPETAGQAEAVVSLRQVNKEYPRRHDTPAGFGEFLALQDVSLEVSRGQIVGIIGRNGAGKTTLLNIIAGVLHPTQGQARVKGRVLGLFGLGVGFQDELTGRENIFLNGSIMGASRKEVEAALGEIIEFSELADFIDMPLGTYSQGMRLRLGFGVVASLNFDILVIDEILAVGDILFQHKCFQKLMDFRRAGKTLVITTQDTALIERICDQALLLDHGEAVFSGRPAECVAKYHQLLNTEKFFVGPPGKNKILVRETKRWAEEAQNRGKQLGTQQVVIESVDFLNRFGAKVRKINSGVPLSVRVNFLARDHLENPHFGVAVFRKDGVYCYGPNTAFDGYSIPCIPEGKGWFSIAYEHFFLAPGEYAFSVAVWDEKEALAFTHHYFYYDLKVTGAANPHRALLAMPIGSTGVQPNLDLLSGGWEKKQDHPEIKIGAVALTDLSGKPKEVFFTGQGVAFRINFTEFKNERGKLYFWAGIYRSDGIYCQGCTRRIISGREVKIIFPQLDLLPGEYRISFGVWDEQAKEFLLWQHGISPLRMVFDREDHGTIYLRHKWQWKLP